MDGFGDAGDIQEACPLFVRGIYKGGFPHLFVQPGFGLQRHLD
jgi:hypothetical protein